MKKKSMTKAEKRVLLLTGQVASLEDKLRSALDTVRAKDHALADKERNRNEEAHRTSAAQQELRHVRELMNAKIEGQHAVIAAQRDVIAQLIGPVPKAGT